jgi:eukaryotic-like serine/threonine-protein kinase
MSVDRATNEPELPPGGAAPVGAVTAAMGAPQDPGSDAALEDLVAEATDDFVERVRRGERPSVEEYARRFPQIAQVLRGLLPALSSAQRGSSAIGSAESRLSDVRVAGSSGANPGVDAAANQLGCLGEFRLIREIGRGGMGVVYEAEQISLGRRVALKVLPLAAALDPRQLQRFRLEAQAAAHLHHSHIVPIYSVGCERGAYYYAMQFIEGRSLAEVIGELERQVPGRAARGADRVTAESPTVSDYRSASQASGNAVSPDIKPSGEAPSPPADPPGHSVSPTAETAVRQPVSATQQSIQSPAWFRTIAGMGMQVAEALDYAHGMGVIHRDVKPANLLLDNQGQLYIADFGLAQLQGDSRLTRTGDLVGTLRYMSPEQTTARHGVVDHRADLYSLGATLYELLTLVPAFDAPDRGALLRQIADEEPPAPRQRNRAIPVDLETIVLKAMAKEPHRRYATAKELADDLGRFLEHRPITARRPTVAERASKWVRRHRAIVTTAALLLVLTGMVVARERYQAEANQRARAEESLRQAREIVDFFTGVSRDEMADRVELQPLRRMMLAAALDYYQDFIEQVGDNPSLQKELAASHLNVASILDAIGSRDEALEALEKARQIQEKVAHGQPAAPVWQNSLPWMYRRFDELRGHRELDLLSRPSIQEDLGLSDDQVKRASELWDERRQFARQIHGGRFGRDSQPLTAEQWEAGFERLKSQEKALTNLLTPEQSRRLQQLLLQQGVPDVFSDPEVAEKLGLSQDQIDRIRTINQERPSFGSRDRGGPPHNIGDLLRKNRDQIFDVLSDEQKVRWKEMTGVPFEGNLSSHWRGGPGSSGGHGGRGADGRGFHRPRFDRPDDVSQPAVEQPQAKENRTEEEPTVPATAETPEEADQ